MTFEQVMAAIRDLAKSQGFYGRLYYSIMELEQNNSEEFAYFKADIEGQHFTDIVEILDYFES